MAQLGTEWPGVGGQVPVGDGQHLGHGAAVTDDDVTGLGLRAVVIDIQQGEEQRAGACGRWQSYKEKWGR